MCFFHWNEINKLKDPKILHTICTAQQRLNERDLRINPRASDEFLTLHIDNYGLLPNIQCSLKQYFESNSSYRIITDRELLYPLEFMELMLQYNIDHVRLAVY